MQALSILPLPHKFLDYDDFAFASGSLDREDEKLEQQEEEQEFSFACAKNPQDLHEKLEQREEEQEFSFACANPQGSLVTADEIFHNGKIRPLFPVFDQSSLFSDGGGDASLPLKKLFSPAASKPQGALEGLFQDLSLKTKTLDLEVEDSKEMCKKSNSTGFSKLLRSREDLKLRSYSDGKDAFVFFNPPVPAPAPRKSGEAKVKNDVVKNGKRKTAPSSSAHEKLYMMNRKRKEGDKRRSFLPYKQGLFGYFANMNGFSRNLHPF